MTAGSVSDSELAKRISQKEKMVKWSRQTKVGCHSNIVEVINRKVASLLMHFKLYGPFERI